MLVRQHLKMNSSDANFRSIMLVDAADVPIIKINYAGLMADISVGQVSEYSAVYQLIPFL